MGKTRAIIVDGEGIVRLADGKMHNARIPELGTPYDLDAAVQKGAKFAFTPYAIGSGTSLLILVQEADEKPI